MRCVKCASNRIRSPSRSTCDWERALPASDRHRCPALPLLAPNATHVFDLLLQMSDATRNLSPVGFQLSFARASGADSTSQLGHLCAPPGQARHYVFQLRQFHLQLTFPSARVRRKDVENQLGAIDHSRVYYFFDVALLGGGEVMIEQDQIGRGRRGRPGNLFQLAAPDQSGRIGSIPALQDFADNLGPGADGQIT